ncbi:MAG: glycosyltransferase family 2 protein [Desulfomicrobium sp.]|nr:glycosyltransferase family 2 protein [Pseudomonadota bacterium]MBU4571984.1 glycosyltransferase family 2 protein [Pseudomonadota bacterium]MBV1713014.1 glycosyltransferase family 2 protein [Desulfomicrobium sp.]
MGKFKTLCSKLRSKIKHVGFFMALVLIFNKITRMVFNKYKACFLHKQYGKNKKAFSSIPRKKNLITMVKNESALIDVFLAHALTMFDNIIIVDHMSTDGTYEYIHSLRSRFPQIRCYRFCNEGYFQSEVMTWIVHHLVDADEEGWVFFLDADEFLPFATREEFDRELIELSSYPVIALSWKNLVPLEMDSGTVHGTFFLKPPKESEFHKIAFQPNLIPLKSYRIAQGNHALLIGKSDHQYYPAKNGFPIYHLPVRTRRQMIDKIHQGVNAYRKMGQHRNASQGIHWDEIACLVNNENLAEEVLIDMVVRYGFPLVPPYGMTRVELLAKGYEQILINVEMYAEFPKFENDVYISDQVCDIYSNNAGFGGPGGQEKSITLDTHTNILYYA